MFNQRRGNSAIARSAGDLYALGPLAAAPVRVRCRMVCRAWSRLGFFVLLAAVTACGPSYGGGGAGVYIPPADVVADGDGAAGEVQPGDAGLTDTPGVEVGPPGTKDSQGGDGTADTKDAGGPKPAVAASPCNDQNLCPVGVCAKAANVCVACLGSEDCGPGKVCVDQQCVASGTCKSDVECKAKKQVCAKEAGVCVDCNLPGDCGAGFACIGHKCHAAPACTTSKDCPKVCDLSSGLCADCLGSDDCKPGEFCSPDHLCVPDLCGGGGCGTGGDFFVCKPDGSGFQSGVSCNDGSPCTDSACSEAGGCSQTPNSKTCDDGNACTKGDKCQSGECEGSTVSCDDKNPCTTDLCKPVSGCANAPNKAACNDNSDCTSGDACANGSCQGVPTQCDDKNPCTYDGCEPGQGCAYTNSTENCTDGNACTTDDLCKGGSCKGMAKGCDDFNLCTADSCDALGGCKHKFQSASCDDGNACTISDTCSLLSGLCVGGAVKPCSDDNPCTNDTCSGGQCQSTNNSTVCNDNNLCTDFDKCSSGTCKPGTPKVCNDANACTTDSCTPSTGCVFTANSDTCSDGNTCTETDACANKTCSGKPKVCTDGDSCTLDTCTSNAGCAFNPDKVKCDDFNPCTADSCTSPGGACVNAPIAGCCSSQAACDDKQACTLDICAGNKCVNQDTCCKSAADCGDSNDCTVDKCESGVCSHVTLPDSPTAVASYDWETSAEGWSTAAAVQGLSWSQKSGKGAKVGQGAWVYGIPTAESIGSIKTTASVLGTGPSVTLPAGVGYKLQGWVKVDSTGGTFSNFVELRATLKNASYMLVTKSNASKDWQYVDVDVGFLAGKSFSLQVRGSIGGTTTVPSTGSGIYVDGLKLLPQCTAKACKTASECASGVACIVGQCNAGTCAYPTSCCSAQADCNDNNACTTDICSGGGCVFAPIANCCSASTTCNDNNACTLDSCGADKKCTFAPIAGCCANASQCDDKQACTVDACSAAGMCSHTNTCCKSNSECQDGETTCTTDTCQDGACKHTPTGAAGCCSPVTTLEAFDGAALTGWVAANSTGLPNKGWQQWKAPPVAKSAPGVLYYGDPATKNFDFGTSTGTMTSPAIAVPANAGTPSLRFWLYMGTESGTFYDVLSVSLKVGTSFHPGWNKSSSTVTDAWTEVPIDLTVHKGKEVQVVFTFKTGDSAGNTGYGVLIDDLRLVQTCK